MRLAPAHAVAARCAVVAFFEAFGEVVGGGKPCGHGDVCHGHVGFFQVCQRAGEADFEIAMHRRLADMA